MDDVIHDLTPAYALDALDADEAARYEAHLATCEECRAELERMWSVAGALAHGAAGPPPPAGLRERILEQARSERSERSNVVPLRRRFAVPAAASFAAVAAVAALALGLWATSLSRELGETRRDAAANADAVAVLADPSARQIPLAGADGRVVVASGGRAALVLSGVAPAPRGKTYEIWVVEGGTPQRAGLFRSAETRTVIAITRPVPDQAVVAVTLEDEGGVDVPQGPRVFTSRSV
jgi:anti-sigma-K factor RskA